jgi:hypothetical protein
MDEWYQGFSDVESLRLDLSQERSCRRTADGVSNIYNPAANKGGMGFIERNKALCMFSVLINTHMPQAALKSGVKRFFFSSSACVYNGAKQKTFGAPSIEEEDAYPLLAEAREVQPCGFCNESGPLDLAAAVSTPVVAWLWILRVVCPCRGCHGIVLRRDIRCQLSADR